MIIKYFLYHIIDSTGSSVFLLHWADSSDEDYILNISSTEKNNIRHNLEHDHNKLFYKTLIDGSENKYVWEDTAFYSHDRSITCIPFESIDGVYETRVMLQFIGA